MSTATIARVCGVIAASTADGSRLSVDASTSANTGVAPSRMKQFAVATNEIGDVITSSPSPRPKPWQRRCRPAVPLVTVTAYGAPTRSAKSSSKRSITGPIESLPERSTSRTSSSSRCPMYGLESGIRVIATTDRRPLTPGRAGLRPGLASEAAKRRYSRFGGSALRDGGVLEPVAPALAAAADGFEVGLLERERHRPGRPDLVVVDRADRGHLGRGADHEDLVREVEV